MANFFKVFKYVIFGGGSRILTNQSERTGLFDPDTLKYRILFFENMKVFLRILRPNYAGYHQN